MSVYYERELLGTERGPSGGLLTKAVSGVYLQALVGSDRFGLYKLGEK